MDKRSKLSNQLVYGIKNIKLNAWEKIIQQKMEVLRKEETVILRKMMTSFFLSYRFVESIQPISILFCILSHYVFVGSIGFEKAYSIVMYITVMSNPLTIINAGIMLLISMRISLTRINELLSQLKDQEDVQLEMEDQNLSEESKESARIRTGVQGSYVDISVKNGYFGWDLEKGNQGSKVGDLRKFSEKDGSDLESLNRDSCLRDMNFEITGGEFVGVIGKVGSGKTSLFEAILGNMNKHTGETMIQGSVAYISQESFIINDTIRENVLFGKSFNEERYNHVLDICQLREDLQTLPAYDLTEIGERGINLSGGQKQRVSIARAVYADSDIYLIDDALSALDAFVGAAILKQVFQEELKDKTRVMSTHLLHFLNQLDRIIFMKEGKITSISPFDELCRTQYYKEFDLEAERLQTTQTGPKPKEGQMTKMGHILEGKENKLRKGREEDERKINDIQKSFQEGHTQHQGRSPIDNQDEKKGLLIKQEEKQRGIIRYKVYNYYLSSSGSLVKLGFIASMIFLSIISLFNTYWIGRVGGTENSKEEHNEPQIYLIYLLLTSTVCIALFLNAPFCGYISGQASFKILTAVTWNLLRRPISFFDTTQSGTIQNRCVDDVAILDLPFQKVFFNFVFLGTKIFSAYLVNSINTPLILAIVIPLCFPLFFLSRMYLITSTELRRLKRISKSKILTTMAEYTCGERIIRCFGFTDQFKQKWLDQFNLFNTILTHDKITYSWYLVVIDFIFSVAVMVVFIGVVFSLLLPVSLTKDPAVCAFFVSSIVSVTPSFSSLAYRFSEVATMITAIERLKEYEDYDDFEADFEHPEPGEEPWPIEGRVSVKKVSVKYRKGLQYVLDGLSFEVESRQKVGVLGRTGSGKSTLMLVLMRILELNNHGDDKRDCGFIEMDGIDISGIGLHHLRRAITIIPQDPYLIEGSLRENIDPFGLHSDQEITEVLEALQLGNIHTSLTVEREEEQEENRSRKKDANFLSFKIEGNGSNLSLGQRQIICFARALIEKPKILLMDEATASIDQKTDSIIQTLIKKELIDTTVITIAHRIETIIDYDKLVILDSGKKVEEGSPLSLLESEDSYFNILVKETGEDFRERMLSMLEEN